MHDAERVDALDRLLSEYYQPVTASGNLASTVARAVRRTQGALAGLERRLSIQASAAGVTLIREQRLPAPDSAAGRRRAEQAREEIGEFLRGQRSFFAVPVDLEGVGDFQRRVLETARGIPFGEIRPYAWIADRIGHPRAVRAVGTALGRNPVPIIVPCHRVGRTDGGLGGYLFGLPVKQGLWALERTTPVLEGCTTTRIVCRVGCAHARHMRADHRVVFASVADARGVGYRPCKVCQPAA